MRLTCYVYWHLALQKSERPISEVKQKEKIEFEQMSLCGKSYTSHRYATKDTSMLRHRLPPCNYILKIWKINQINNCDYMYILYTHRLPELLDYR